MEGMTFNASKKRLQSMTNEEWEKDGIDEKPQEEKHRHLEVKFPESRIKELESLYSTVIVRDFGDEYHETEKEKEDSNELYKIFKPIRSHRTRYNSIVDFVYAMRECYDFVEALAKKNRLIMDPEEFIKEVFTGKIEVSQLTFPIYRGKDRKDINWKNVRRYVLDRSLDPIELSDKVDIKYIPIDVQENPEEHLNEYFSEDQIQTIFHESREDMVSETIPFDETIDDETDGIVLPASRKDIKKLMKRFPDLIRPVKNARMRSQVSDSMRDYVYELNSSAYEYIGRLDEKRGFMASDRVPKFAGNLESAKDVKRYLYQLEEFQEEHERINYHGRFITVSEYKDEMLKEELAKAGWDIKNIYYNKEKEKKRKKEDKKDKKKEKRLRKELSKITDRRNRRNGNAEGDMVNKKKKKHKKSSKKKTKGFENAIARAHGAEDFDEYEKMMLDMSGYEG